MTDLPLHFELPINLSTQKFLSRLGKLLDIEIASQECISKTYYDSFDWRLYNAEMVCEFNQSQKNAHLNLINRNTGKLVAMQEMSDVPRFCGQFSESPLKNKVEPTLEMRALLPLCELPLEIYRINVLNEDQKTILRLQVDQYKSLTTHISLCLLKGYEKEAKKTSNILKNSLKLKPTRCTALNEALAKQGRKPGDYSSKVTIELKANMSAEKASKVIYQYLLQAMQANEAGTIADIDSEYLHDFRVAVRRTRAGLNQIKNTLPANSISQHADFFAWLGQITGFSRDMDVYLLSYKQYKLAVPATLQDDLTPLYDFLKQKQKQAQKKLAKNLQSKQYKKQLLAWEKFLNTSASKAEKGSAADVPIKELAGRRIWKVYQCVLDEGNAIDESTPAEALHDLRKTCKKLRYLMEFFQSLYPENKIKMLIKALKNFQTVLGDFQDYEVQEINIKQFGEEMMANNVATNTLLAMGVLIQHLNAMKCSARNDFAEQFKLFKKTKNQNAFKTLFTKSAKKEKK